MVKFSEFIKQALIIIAWTIISLFLVAFTEYKFLVVPLTFLSLYILITDKRNKKILPYVTEDFKKRGFELLDERPFRLSDQKFTFTISSTFNNVPISRYGYLRKFFRVFKARANDGKLYAVKAEITQHWNKKIDIEIISTKPYIKREL